MMFTCTVPGCARAGHSHSLAASRARPSKASRPARHAAVAKKLAKGRKGGALRIDIHCHYLNRDAAAKVAHLNPAQYEPQIKFANALTREVNVKQMQDRGPKLTSIEVRLKDMDRMGIDIQAVSPAPQQTYYWAEPGLGLEVSRMINDRLAEIVAQWPERFVGLGTVPLQNVELAVIELERCVKKLGLRGVEINPNVVGKDLTDPSLNLDRFFAKARELDIVIFMHPTGYTQGERLTDHYFNNIIGNPLDTTVGTSRLIFDGVMERHPGLKIVLPHAGGFLAHYWARMDHAWRARPDCRTVIKKAPSSYLKKFYFDTIAFDPEMLRNLHRQVRRGPGGAGDGLPLRHGRRRSGRLGQRRAAAFRRRQAAHHGRKWLRACSRSGDNAGSAAASRLDSGGTVMKQIGVAIIGTGWCGGIRAETCAAHALTQSLHLAEIRPERLAEVAKATGAKTAVADYRELLRNGGDRRGLHLGHAGDHALPDGARLPRRPGKHVFLEKPIAMELAEADELIALARKNKLKFTIGYSQRFNPKFAYVRKSIRDGTIGKPVSALVSRHITRSLGKKISGRIKLSPAAMESTHDLDFVLWCLEPAKPVRVYSQVNYGAMQAGAGGARSPTRSGSR